jgi:hypothetical protein
VKPAAKGAAGHYHNNANIHDPQVARAVYERAMEAPITVTQRELLSLAPEVRAQVADATVRKRVPRDTAAQAMVEEAPDGQDLRRVHLEAMPHATIEEIPDNEAPTSQHEEVTLASHMPAAFIAAA